jgi:hypothetical protein
MLALFLNHPPMFVTGEIALCLSLALFVGALIAAIVRRASEISQLREAGHPNTTIVRQSLAEPIYARPNVPRPATATTPVVRSRAAIRVAPTRHLVLRRLGPDARAVSPWKFRQSLRQLAGGVRRLIRTRRKSMERPPSRPGGRLH